MGLTLQKPLIGPWLLGSFWLENARSCIFVDIKKKRQTISNGIWLWEIFRCLFYGHHYCRASSISMMIYIKYHKINIKWQNGISISVYIIVPSSLSIHFKNRAVESGRRWHSHHPAVTRSRAQHAHTHNIAPHRTTQPVTPVTHTLSTS